MPNVKLMNLSFRFFLVGNGSHLLKGARTEGAYRTVTQETGLSVGDYCGLSVWEVIMCR